MISKEYKRRLLITGVILIMILGGLAARIHRIQIEDASRILSTRFTNIKTLNLLSKLYDQGVLKSNKDGKVLVDKNKLEKAIKSAQKRKYISNIASRARRYPGDKGFDYRLVTIAPTFLPPGSKAAVLRGTIYDRNGVTLAQSKLSPRSNRQSRKYPLGGYCSQVLGFHNPVHGVIGLERAIDDILCKPGDDPQKGTDVYLTLDADLQIALGDLLEGHNGAAILLKVKTGEILAAISQPFFNPEQATPDDWFKARTENQGRLLLSKPWQKLYPPGSTFKLVTAAAWLESNPINAPWPKIYCTGRDKKLKISDISAHGKTDLQKALIKSCNIYFAKLGHELGPKVRDTAQLFGFNRKIDLLPQLRDFKLKSALSTAYARREYNTDASPQKDKSPLRFFQAFDGDYRVAAQCAIGQNLVMATPLQMASVTQAIANNGCLMEPHLLQAINDNGSASSIKAIPAMPGKQILRRKTAAILKKAMTKVMQTGTGRRAPKIMVKKNEIAVAGKTGTAETGRKGEKPHAWFVGFAPAHSPEIAVAVVLENGGLGGKQAAPLGVRMLAAALGAQVK